MVTDKSSLHGVRKIESEDVASGMSEWAWGGGGVEGRSLLDFQEKGSWRWPGPVSNRSQEESQCHYLWKVKDSKMRGKGVMLWTAGGLRESGRNGL